MQLLHLFKQFFLYFLHLFKEFSCRILHLFKLMYCDFIIFSACQFKNYREGNFVQNGKSGLEMGIAASLNQPFPPPQFGVFRM